VDSFQKKTNKKRDDRSDLDRAVNALQAKDSELMEALAEVLDLDAFYRYWATECLVGFWDSYSGNNNNYFIYRDPASDKFHFIPWGTDSSMKSGSGKSKDASNPKSVQAYGIISNRLYQLPEGREIYRAELRELLETVWNEEELLAELDRIQIMIKPHVHIPGKMLDGAMNELREFIRERRSVLMGELSGPVPEWKAPLRVARQSRSSEPTLLFPTLKCDFETVWTEDEDLVNLLGSLKFDLSDLPVHGKADLDINLFDPRQNIAEVKVFAVPNTAGIRVGFPALYLFWKYEGMSKGFGTRLLVDPGFYQTDKEVPVDGYAVFAYMVEQSHGSKRWARSAWIRGKLSFDETGNSEGKPISGRLNVELLTRAREVRSDE
jgi:hypothetical protein